MKYLTIALFLISLAGCSDDNTDSGIRLKNGYYDGYFLYNTLYLWGSFRVKADTFVELASGGVRYQKNHIPWEVSTPEEQGMSSLTFGNKLFPRVYNKKRHSEKTEDKRFAEYVIRITM